MGSVDEFDPFEELKWSEDKLQAWIVQRAWNTYPETRGLLFHVPNGGARNIIEATLMKGKGVIAGVPDLLFIWNGKLHGCELKIKGGVLSKQQIELHRTWAGAGIAVTVCWNRQEFFTWFRNIINSK